MKKCLLFLCLAASLTLSSCASEGGGSDDNGESIFDLPPKAKVNSLSGSEQASFCRSLRDFAEREGLDEKLCRLLVFGFADAFETSVEECEENMEQCTISSGPADCEILDSCDVTVGDYEHCLRAQIPALDDVLERATCKEAARPGQSTIGRDDATPAECRRLRDLCEPQ